MNIEKEKIEQLKKLHPQGVYEGEIAFDDETGARHTVSFVYRVPTTADVEAFLKAAQKNPLVANCNLIQSLIVHPDPGGVMSQIREYPIAAGQFVDQAINPFFGGNVAVRSARL